MNQKIQDKKIVDFKNLYNAGISPDGNWAVFIWDYNTVSDTVVVQHTTGIKKYVIPGGTSGDFDENSNWFICSTGNDEMLFLELKSGRKIQRKYVRTYQFSKNNNFLALMIRVPVSEELRNRLVLIDLRNKITLEMDANDMAWKPGTTKLVITTEDQGTKSGSLVILDMDNLRNSRLLYDKTESRYHHLQWDKLGKVLLYREDIPLSDKTHTILHYYESKGKSKILDLREKGLAKFFKLSVISSQISLDASRVLVYLDPIREKKVNSDNSVEVWRTDDPRVYPYRKLRQNPYNSPRQAVWYPLRDTLIILGSDRYPEIEYNIDHSFALNYDPWQGLPNFKYSPDADIYLIDVQTGFSKKILEKQYLGYRMITLSPGGNFICYFRDSNWWIYDIHKGKYFNITKGISESFENSKKSNGNVHEPYGIAGWTKNDSEVILYSRDNIWKIRPDGSQKNRLTSGKDQQQQFRVARASMSKQSIPRGINFSISEVDTEKGLLVKVLEYRKGFGYFLLRDKKMDTIVYHPGKIDYLLIDKNKDMVIYRQQSYDMPTRISTYSLETGQRKIVAQAFGGKISGLKNKMEVLTYTNDKGELLHGALLYPINYDKKRKYPMVVEIYERMTGEGFVFNHVSEYSYLGFNPANYIHDGYFVFYPDIEYEPGNPGISAVTCVESGIKTVLDKGVVNKNKVGLIGHSFGGYEAAFIATQSKMFAAVVAGAPITNVPGWSHTIGLGNRSNIYRVENDQFQMEVSYFDNLERYFKNSPFEFVKNINTPLLLWSGKKDSNVDYHQSVQLYFAMRRLNKPGTLLLYPEEDHVIMNPENQKDLTKRVKEWFDRYLK